MITTKQISWLDGVTQLPFTPLTDLSVVVDNSLFVKQADGVLYFRDGLGVDHPLTTGALPLPANIVGPPFAARIIGRGYFIVQLPDGSLGYTLDGHLRLDATGLLVTDQDGFPVEPSISAPPGFSAMTIGPDGTVSAILGGVPIVVGQMNLAAFFNPEGLVPSVLYPNYLVETPASGPPTVGTPTTGGLGYLAPLS